MRAKDVVRACRNGWIGPGLAEVVLFAITLPQTREVNVVSHPLEVDFNSGSRVDKGDAGTRSTLLPAHCWIRGVIPRTLEIAGPATPVDVPAKSSWANWAWQDVARLSVLSLVTVQREAREPVRGLPVTRGTRGLRHHLATRDRSTYSERHRELGVYCVSDAVGGARPVEPHRVGSRGCGLRDEATVNGG